MCRKITKARRHRRLSRNKPVTHTNRDIEKVKTLEQDVQGGMEPEGAEKNSPSGEGAEPRGTTPRARAVRLPPALQDTAKEKYGDLSKHALRWYLSVDTPIPLPMLGVEKPVLTNLDVAMGHDEMRPAVKRSALRKF
jgi:hypothetical protein